jgi:hypothetical protein
VSEFQSSSYQSISAGLAAELVLHLPGTGRRGDSLQSASNYRND